jgi:hypothetical protein
VHLLMIFRVFQKVFNKKTDKPLLLPHPPLKTYLLPLLNRLLLWMTMRQ